MKSECTLFYYHCWGRFARVKRMLTDCGLLLHIIKMSIQRTKPLSKNYLHWALLSFRASNLAVLRRKRLLLSADPNEVCHAQIRRPQHPVQLHYPSYQAIMLDDPVFAYFSRKLGCHSLRKIPW